MFTLQRGQIEDAVRQRADLSARELAFALAGSRSLSLKRGGVAIEPSGRDRNQPAEQPGGVGRAPRWQYRPPAPPAGSVGPLYNIDTPRRALRASPRSVVELLDALREDQLLTVDGPATLGDTCVRNLRADRASMLAATIDSLDVGLDGLRVAGPATFGDTLDVAGAARLGGTLSVANAASFEGGVVHNGSVTNNGDTIQNGPVTFNGDVTFTGDGLEPVPLALVPVRVVTDISWSNDELRQTSQIVYVARVTSAQSIDVVVSGTACPATPLDASSSNFGDMP